MSVESPKSGGHIARRYSLAGASVAGAALLQAGLRPIVGDAAQYMLFISSVLLAAAVGGTGPGLVAMGLGALTGAVFFVSPHGGLPLLGHPDDIIRLAVFLVIAATASLMAGRMREAEAKYRCLVEESLVGVYLIQAGHFVYVNARLAEIFGYRPEEIVAGRTVMDLVAPQDRPLVAENLRKREEGEIQSIQYSFKGLRKDGQAIDVEVLGTRTRYRGKPAVIGSLLDITERKRAEEALQRTNQLMGAILNHTHMLVACLDRDFNFVLVNDAYADAQDEESEYFAGKNYLQLFPNAGNEAVLRDVRATGRPYFASARPFVTAQDPQGRTRHWDWGVVPIADAGGSVQLLVLTLADVTPLKRAEDASRQARAAAEQANAAKDQFLAVLSHELRTPLTPVLTAIAMLHDDARCDPNVRETLEMVRRNVEMEARLIDDLLDMTRIARGKIELDKRPVELGAVIARAAEVCKADIEARGLHFGVDIGPCAPYWVEGDVGRLQQVFWNLIKNAVKFTPHGGCVGIRCRREAEDHAIVEVNDSGIGIEPENLSRIFNAFEQAERSITRQFGGLGLGLAISKVLVELHGGTITACSKGKGKGSMFAVRLPMCKAQLPMHGAHPSSEPRAQIAGRHLKILLVEDHGDTAKMMQRLLMMDGHDVAIAGDVATALEAAGKHSFDLILSDLGLPDASGLDLLQELRSRGHKTPAIALSGYGQEQDIQRSKEAGFAAHLTKPANPDRLAETIAAVAGRRD